ncbi:NAD(P)/FAD-dependent oxidoreductase [Kordiimonas aquimaris]|uniref:NAD(P)/FAD-dependent oxidoreductase n=1 Tax=Kordiimonas aquimaris TaxID=707591 RepID=UPI0021D0ECEC|nr:NAD(P)/FAD-dependent oxidoreductase [Kordiimonas aquimaris]
MTASTIRDGYVTEKVDCIVIGAGVIGLSVARELQQAGREVLLLEKANMIGTETSSRNSEVIHAGIYYPKDSLKAQLCVAGRDMLYDYCDRHHVPVNRYGKLIVATDETQRDSLNDIYQKGVQNGVSDLERLDAKAVNAIAPAVKAVAAINSPSTGVVDSHQLMLSLLGDFETSGGILAVNSPVKGGRLTEYGIQLDINCEPSISIEAKIVVNCAGLSATDIAHSIIGMTKQHIPQTRYAKGSYFAYDGKSPFDRLIYPIPFVGGLGIHLTLDAAGAARIGPDIEWVDRIDYNVNADLHEKFVTAVQTYWPDIDPSKLHPSYAGVRPKIVAPQVGDQDFVISDIRSHGVDGLYHLFGYDSPGLTSCLAIGAYIKRIILERSA